MEKPTFNEILTILEELQANVFCDLKSDWIEENERNTLREELHLLNTAFFSLKMIQENKGSFVFNNIKF